MAAEQTSTRNASSGDCLLLHQALRAAAHSQPERAAVVDGGRTVSYAELDVWSNRLANLLQESGVRRGDRVGLYLDKSAEALAGIYATLKTGACYVPLDPASPIHRLRHTVADCGIRALLSDSTKAAAWPELFADMGPHDLSRVVVALDAAVDPDSEQPVGVGVHGADDVLGHSTSAPDVSVDQDDLAYILYTSGSTGRPKGVMLSHRNALCFVDWAVEAFAVTGADRLSSHAPLHFDLSVFDLFAAARSAATVVLVPRRAALFPAELARFIADAGITVWYSVPSALSLLLRQQVLVPGACPELRVVLFAGEVFPTPQLRQLMALMPHARFANLYGPTETNVCTWYEVPTLPDDQTTPVPIGLPIPGVTTWLVDAEGRIVADGQVGELWVQGPTVMRGYWGDPARTAEALVTPPAPGPSYRAYRTGDLARRAASGDYLFLGRRDRQIKSRGHRIELGEIESALYADPDVVECTAVAVPDPEITNRLVACVVVRDGVDAVRLRKVCHDRLPRYMIPESFQMFTSLPRTSTGKVDRRALARELTESCRRR